MTSFVMTSPQWFIVLVLAGRAPRPCHNTAAKLLKNLSVRTGSRYGGCNVTANEVAPHRKRDALDDEATGGRVDDKISRARDGSNQPRDQSGRLDVRM
jgi:hypothetical protein